MEYNLVEVSIREITKGECLFEEEIRSYHYPRFDDCPLWQTSVETGPSWKAEQNFTLFRFRFCGDLPHQDFASGLEWNFDLLEPDDLFGEWLAELKQQSAKLKSPNRQLGESANFVRFLTVWSYQVCDDEPNHPDSEWSLLGYLPTSKLKDYVEPIDFYIEPPSQMLQPQSNPDGLSLVS